MTVLQSSALVTSEQFMVPPDIPWVIELVLLYPKKRDNLKVTRLEAKKGSNLMGSTR